ncbi:MAG: type II toxin-antitoxin system HicA family toxin [Sedimentisphaerales bacterium]|nr:type II toxin-antitoxin system HicA family toxin [Sedimentisphaerales bacterium]
MSKLKLINAKEMEKLLLRLGFEKVRQKCSHAFYRHPDGRVTTVPHHKAKLLARPLIREILREIEITIEEYNKNL